MCSTESSDNCELNTEFSFDDSQSVEKSILLLKSQSSDITTLPEGFNLHRMPQNYLNRRSYIEKIIFHATMSDALKSPFSGFTIANRYIGYLDSIDVISGIHSLKQLAKLALDPNQRTSVMVHRVCDTWLLDEFDIDSFLLVGERSRDWAWLRRFLMKKKIYLCAEAFSRNALILRDLYKKFLYHTVGHLPQLGLQTFASLPWGNEMSQKCLPFPESCSSSSPERSGEDCEFKRSASLELNEFSPSSHLVEPISPLSEVQQTVGASPRADSASKRPWAVNPDEYLHMAKWKLRDLSFLIGSDLAIFGTHKHPCISLKLSPKHEAINVLTGVDMWLENILNEVPEVAMCYHHEGIVMQEYEIHKTCDLPSLAGFETSHIYNTVRNLIMFLKRNATKEGHTYWLVKEPGIDIVKLYDLTTLCDDDMVSGAENTRADSETAEMDLNPFIMPVATLCYRLAELRWREYRTVTEGRLQEDDTFRQDLLADELSSLTDALRLLRNCLDLITMVETGSDCSSSDGAMPTGLNDLKIRSVLLLCQLYLSTPTNLLNACIRRLRPNSTREAEEFSVSVNELTNPGKPEHSSSKSIGSSPAGNSLALEATSEPHALAKAPRRVSKRQLLGSLLIKALQSSDTTRLSHVAVGIIESCSISPSVANQKVLPTLAMQRHGSHDSTRQESFQREMSDYLLTISTVKSCLCNAEELWSRFFPIPDSSANVDALGCLLRYTLSSVLLLEHLIPDQYTAVSSPPSTDGLVCPLCGRTDQFINQCSRRVDRCALVDMLHIASCLLPAAVACCVDAVRSPGFAADSLDSLSFRAKTADSVLLRLACPEAAAKLEPLLNGAIYGAVDEEKVIGFVKPSSDITVQWMDVLCMSLRCLYRALSTRVPHSKAPTAKTHKSKGANLDPTDAMQRLQLNPHSGTLLHHTVRLRVQLSWWPALINFYVLGMRKSWLSGKTMEKALEIAPHIGRCLTFLCNQPLSVDELDGQLRIITYTSEFQCYKLAATLSHHSEAVLPWITSHLRSLPSCVTPVLPRSVLTWQPDECEPKSSAPKTLPRSTTECLSFKYTVTAVCLARAMDSMLRCLASAESENTTLRTQLCSSVMTTCNEYIYHCLNNADLSKRLGVTQLNILRNMIKQIMRLLPNELTVDPSRYPAGAHMSLGPISKTLVPQLLDLRLHQMNIELRLHEHCSIQNGSRAQTPAWSTIVAHARAVFQWYVKQMVLPTLTNTEQIDPSVIQDYVMLIKWTYQLVTLQSVNKDVLSPSGLVTILKDVALVHPVLKVLTCRLSSDPALMGCKSELESPLRMLLHRLFVLCRTILWKQQFSSKPTRKAGNKQKADRRLKPTEVNLAESILSSDIVDVLQFSSEEEFSASLCKANYTTVESIASLLVVKTELLTSFLS